VFVPKANKNAYLGSSHQYTALIDISTLTRKKKKKENKTGTKVQKT